MRKYHSKFFLAFAFIYLMGRLCMVLISNPEVENVMSISYSPIPENAMTEFSSAIQNDADVPANLRARKVFRTNTIIKLQSNIIEAKSSFQLIADFVSTDIEPPDFI